MDGLGPLIQKIRLGLFEGRRRQARRVRDAKRQQSEAASALDMLQDRIDLEVPLKERSEMLHITDAEYLSYVKSVIEERNVLLFHVVHRILERMDQRDDWDRTPRFDV